MYRIIIVKINSGATTEFITKEEIARERFDLACNSPDTIYATIHYMGEVGAEFGRWQPLNTYVGA